MNPAPRLRVLINALHSKSGGGITYLRNVLPLMARAPGVEVHLCIHPGQRDSLPTDIEGITVHELSFRPGFFRTLLIEQARLPALARRIGADTTFSPANYGPLRAPNAVLLLRNATGVAFVEKRPAKMIYWAGVYIATFLSALTCKRVIAVSDYARRSVMAGWPKQLHERTHVVWHGVGDRFSPPPEGVARESFILAVSDIYVQKNLANLLRAVARLKASHPSIRLRIAGATLDPAYFESLKVLIAENGLDENVEFLGSVPPDRLTALYQSCGLFVFPSTVETFGNPLVEAMACGAAIASSNTAAMPEILGDAGLYFDPQDEDSIAGTVGRLLDDAKARAEFGRKALERAKAFSWPQTVEKTLAVLRTAAGRD